MEIATRTRTNSLPTNKSSTSLGLDLNLGYISIVKIVDDELKIEVKEDMRAANITANISPLAPFGISSVTNLTNATLVQPCLL